MEKIFATLRGDTLGKPMHLEAFKNFKSFLQAFRTVLTWMVLGFCFLIALAQSIAEIQGLWASGPLHPNPYSHSMPEQDLANLWSGGASGEIGPYRLALHAV